MIFCVRLVGDLDYMELAGEGYICVVGLYNNPLVWDSDIYQEGNQNKSMKFGDGMSADTALSALRNRMNEVKWLIRAHRPK